MTPDRHARRCLTLLVLLLTGALFSTAHAQPTPPAFPGAEGFGALASGGRGGRVITVTTLDRDGEGSLQGALDQPGARTVVFAVSGVIESAVYIRHGDLTLAGETSPGGITVRGLLCDGHYEVDECDNTIVRHLRSRPAGHLPGADEASDDALRLDGIELAIFDHVSLANASDETVQISLARDITIQHSIIAEPISDHHNYGGMLINYSHSQRPQDRLSILENTWVRVTGRLPEISCETTRGFGDDDEVELPSFCSQQPLSIEIAGNLYHDPGDTWVYGDNRPEGYGEPEAGIFTLRMNAIDNYMVVPNDWPYGMILDMFTLQPGNVMYWRGNTVSRYPDYADLDLAYCCNDFEEYGPNTEPPLAVMLEKPHPFPATGDRIGGEAIDWMAQARAAGALPHDPMDTRLIKDVLEGRFDPTPRGQPAADDALSLGFDPADPPSAPADHDGDGMPDEWEQARGLDAAAFSANGFTLSDDGYTDLEVYLHERAAALLP